MKPLLRAALAALLSLAACDGLTDSDDDRSGSLRFDFSGAGRQGTVSASGELELDDDDRPEFDSFAFAFRDGFRGNDALLIDAFQAREEPRGNVVAFLVEPVRGTGSFSLDFDCAPDRGERCAIGIFALDADIEDTDFDAGLRGEVFIFLSGTLTITRLGDRSVEGAFSGTGVFVDFDTGEESRLVEVTGGRFDLPILPEDEIGELAPSEARVPAFSRVPARPVR